MPAQTLTGGSLRRRVASGFVLTTSLLVVAALLAVVGLLAVGHDRTRLLDEVDPAIQHADDYETSLVDQSANARLYAELGGSTALQGYRVAVTRAESARRGLQADSTHLRGLGPDLARTGQLVTAWQQTYLRPLLLAPGPSAAGNSILLRTGSSIAFAGIRRQIALVDGRLESLRAGAVRGFDDAINLLTGLVAAVFIGVALLLVLIWLWVRASVLEPLAALAAESRRVTVDDLDHAVPAVGPVEIAALALDIEAMRSRVVEDLHALETAHLEMAGQRRALEESGHELARSNRDLEQFAYVASHDLQEPLRKVAAFCQLLSDRYDGELDEKGQQYIEFAVDGAKRMQALVNDLLSLSRVGRDRTRWRSVDLGEAARRAAANLESRLAECGGTVRIGDGLPTVHGDATLLTALFQNLIGNALKFRSVAVPSVDVTGRTQGDVCEVRVTDNGIGIDAKHAERVFVIFQRLHTRDRYEGTGIGLALCRRIVEFHGGQIDVEPGPPPGTTIRFTLPVGSQIEEDARA